MTVTQRSQPADALPIRDTRKEGIVHYFEATALDYRYWSRNFHMHFGLWRRWVNPLRLEDLLEETCQIVFDQFGHANSGSFRALDAGCGVGTTLGIARRRFPNADLFGVTLLESQAELASKRLEGLSVAVTADDFEKLQFAEGSFDVVFSIEAAVYGTGPSKERFLQEAFRVLKPGGRLVVMDAYLTRPASSMSALTRWIYNRVREGWSIEDMIEKRAFLESASNAGFTLRTFRSFFFAVAPSVAHVPWATLRYVWDSLVRKRSRSRDSIRHVVACVCGCLLGLCRHRFTYGCAVFVKAADESPRRGL